MSVDQLIESRREITRLTERVKEQSDAADKLLAKGLRLVDRLGAAEARASTAEANLARAVEVLKNLANAKALKGVRQIVAGWNGEGRDEPYTERHPDGLGATLPTTCGAVYDLDEAMVAARALLEEMGK